MDVQLELEVVAKVLLLNIKRMNNKLLYMFILVSTSIFSQETISELLKTCNTKSIPYISVEELAMPKTNAIILDAREKKEFETSHIKNAINVGYDNFIIDSIQDKLLQKDSKIVVYCSIGIRSETIGEKLKKAGYTNVYNLYGGIFEWKNKEFKVFDVKEKETENVHTFNEEWSKWLINGIKIYE